MTFALPDLLWLLALTPAVAVLAAWLWRRRLAADAAWASRGLWDRLLPAYSARRIALSVAFLTLAVTGASLALARPRWGQSLEEVERRGVDVVFLLDSSLSMAATDVRPSRLYVAKALVRRMTRAMPANRVGLVQAEGTGVMLAPLTTEGGVLDMLLDTVEPASLPTPGTELSPGIETALSLFGAASEKHRALVVLSDGEDHGGGLEERIALLKEQGVIVHAFGIGTPQGSRIPIPGTRDLKKDAEGNFVTTRLHEETLEALARGTGGEYLRAVSAAADPAPVLRQIDRMEKRTLESQTLNTRQERFQWPLGLSALALALYLAIGPFLAERKAA